MTPEEAKNIMEDMYQRQLSFALPKGFQVAIYVPKEIADLTRTYYDDITPFGYRGPFAAGEPFKYKGVLCFASSVQR